MTDEEFTAAFAWIYLRRMPLTAAMQRYDDRLRAFAAHLGKPGLYHATITYAFLLLINERMQDGPAGESWAEFQSRNADLFQGVQAALGRYYSAARLASDRSRAGFVMPDRLVG